jgi:hypothetical protein
MRVAPAIAMLVLAGCPLQPPAVEDPDCVVDQDCALLPYATCCGECPPAPPFDVGTRGALDAIFIELETACALDLRACTPPVCDPMPPGCRARAACVDGRCVVESEGCGPLVSYCEVSP